MDVYDMSFRTSPLLRISIKDLYQSKLIEEGNIYSLKNEEGIIYNLVLIQGFITEISEIKGREEQIIHKLFINDYSAGVWIHTSDKKLIQAINLWDFTEVMGSVEFFPNFENDYLELFIRPQTIELIEDLNTEILHIIDSQTQKKSYPQILSKIRFRTQQDHQIIDKNNYNALKSTEEDTLSSMDGPEEIEDDNSKNNRESMIIEIIKANDTGEGVALDIIKMNLDKIHPIEENELEDIIFNLQMEGDLYEPTFRRYRVND